MSRSHSFSKQRGKNGHTTVLPSHITPSVVPSHTPLSISMYPSPQITSLEQRYERDLFLKIRLLQLWSAQDVDYFMHHVTECVHNNRLLLSCCRSCLTIFIAYRRFLTLPAFDQRSSSARTTTIVSCFLGFADACQSSCPQSKARARLMKRVGNGLSGCLSRVVRTSTEREYTESLRLWYSVGHSQNASLNYLPVIHTHSLQHARHKHHGHHKGRRESEHGYRRRTFFDLLDIISSDLSDTGPAGLISILHLCEGSIDKLPPLYRAVVTTIRQTVTDSFVNLKHSRERIKAQRRFNSMPWRTLITLTRYSGRRLSSILLHIVLRMSFGGNTLFSLWIEWVLGIQDIEEELTHLRESNAGVGPDKIDHKVFLKLEDIVDKHFPFNASNFSSRDNLSDLLISTLGEPTVSVDYIDSMTEEMFSNVYAYLNLLVDHADGVDVRKRLLNDKKVVKFATELITYAEEVFVDIVVAGNLSVFLSELYATLKPILKSEKVVHAEHFQHTCEVAADNLTKCVFRFMHSAILNGTAVQKVVVWVLDALVIDRGAGLARRLDVSSLIDSTFPSSDTAERIELEKEINQVVLYYKYTKKIVSPPNLPRVQRLVKPLQEWYIENLL